MSHLSREELIDSLDDALPAKRLAHAVECPRCRAERASLRAVLRDVKRVPVPEPSPLFWDHLSARVRAHIAVEPVPEPARAAGWMTWLAGHRALATAATVLLCVLVTWAGWRELRTVARPDNASAPLTNLIGTSDAADGANTSAAAGASSASIGEARGPRAATVANAATVGGLEGGKIRNISAGAVQDEEWGVMLGLADDVAWEEEGGVNGVATLGPGSADAMVKELTLDERQELARLLHEEMARPPSS